MPTKLSRRTPRYCRQKNRDRADRAYVQLEASRVWLGNYGTPESYRRYAEVIGDHSVGRAQFPDSPSSNPTLSLMMAAYLEYAIQRYGGEKASEVVDFKGAFRVLRKTHGAILARDFGPKAYQQMREAMIKNDWSRGYINEQCQRIKRFIAWGVAEELLPANARHALDAVPGLSPGEFGVRETTPVELVPDDVIATTLLQLSDAVADMVRIMRLTGMRPGELVQLSDVHLKREEEIWLFRPPQHKTLKRGKQRIIPLGPQVQVLLAKYLFSDPCFRYTTASFRRAIHRACDRARIARWSPNQLRHTAATHIRTEFGLEHAQVILGHSHADVTQVYAETTLQKAIEVARKIG